MKEENRHHESSGLLFKNSSTTHSLLTKAGDLRHLILNVTDGADNFFTLCGICYGRRVMHTSTFDCHLPQTSGVMPYATNLHVMQCKLNLSQSDIHLLKRRGVTSFTMKQNMNATATQISLETNTPVKQVSFIH